MVNKFIRQNKGDEALRGDIFLSFWMAKTRVFVIFSHEIKSDNAHWKKRYETNGTEKIMMLVP